MKYEKSLGVSKCTLALEIKDLVWNPTFTIIRYFTLSKSFGISEVHHLGNGTIIPIIVFVRMKVTCVVMHKKVTF